MIKTIMTIGAIALNLGIFFDSGNAATTLISSGLTLMSLGVLYAMTEGGW